MVLTDLPFCRPDALQSRYVLLKSNSTAAPAEEQPESKDSQEYAAFLKEKERRCGPDGFLDSGRFQHSFQVNDGQRRETFRPRAFTSVDISTRKDRDQRDYERRLKVIEDHMWHHKQEERELKRVEGDIIKNQRTVRRTLRDYEQAITRKRMAETKKLNQSMEKYAQQQNHHTHKKENLTKHRIEANIQTEQAHKDLGRKAQLTTSDISRQYNTKLGEIQLKRVELTRMASEFESKVKQKEEEQLRLKQELADLAISMNMESQKARVMEHDFNKEQKKETMRRIHSDQSLENNLDNKLAKNDGDTKNAEIGRRKLSADLSLTRAHLQLKQREEGRHLQDTDNRLRANISEQKMLTEAALHADLDSKSKQMDAKMQDHEQRRYTQAQQKFKVRRELSANHESHFASKFQKRAAEQHRREHEDGLKFFQKMVVKGEERENGLYNKVRNAEYARQKQEQLVKRLGSKLNEMRKQNAAKMKNELTEQTQVEQQLEHKLIKEQAELAKVHAEREDSYLTLQHHRHLLREDRHQMSEHTREHNRLMRIGTRTDLTI